VSRRPAPLLVALAAFLAASAPRRAAAQASATPTASEAALLDAKSAAVVRTEYLADLDTVHVKILALANAIPADKYTWRPGEGVRSVSELLMHVAGEWYFFTPMSVAGKPPADFGPPRESLPKLEKTTAKAQVIAELETSWTHCKAQLQAADPAALTGKYKPWGASLPQAAFGMAGDLHEHLGQLIAYSRAVGVKPPWTK